MAVTELIEMVRNSRRHFWRHLEGLTETQWDWKPFPECKSIRETLAHLVVDDRAALAALQSNGEPDYEAFVVTERDLASLKALLAESHQALCDYLVRQYGNSSPGTTASFWGAIKPLAVGIPFLCSEDYFHTGQVSYIRLATDPSWDYYMAIYGGK